MKIEIFCTDQAGEHLLEILNYFKTLGEVGHTADFKIDDEHFTFDGDGPDRIQSIKFQKDRTKQEAIKIRQRIREILIEELDLIRQ